MTESMYMVTEITRPDAKIWRTAQQFFEAGEIIWAHENRENCIYPLIMNYAFSCELSLKATESLVKQSSVEGGIVMNPINSESCVTGHNLYSIFQKLKQETRDEIQAEFLSLADVDLIPLLEKCANYFVDGRYAFEKIGGSYAISDLRTLAMGLLEAVRVWGGAHGG